MKYQLVFCLWLAIAVLEIAGTAQAASQEEKVFAQATVGQQAPVLGQTSSPTSGNTGSTTESKAVLDANAKKAREAQALFEESLRQMMPLNERQIQEYRERSDQRERALLPVSPYLSSRTVRVSLEPGRAPVKVFTTANIATSLVFHDSTGQPWPITSVTNGGPTFFQVLRPELPDGNLINILPTQGYGTSTLVVTLEKQNIPLVIRLESDSVRSPERKADALVLFQLAHRGPKASVPIIQDIKETVDSNLLAFLDRVPPKGAVRIGIKPNQENLTVWKFGEKHYIRSVHTLMWPAWSAVVNGAGSVKCYETAITGRIMLSNNGRIQTITLNDSTAREERP